MTKKTFTMCVCGAMCACQGALMLFLLHPPAADLVAAIGFGVCGFIVGGVVE